MSDPARLDFKIAVEGSRGALVLGKRRFFSFLDVEALELGLPGLTFPIQITGGLAQLKNEPAFVRRAVFAVTQDGLDELVDERRRLLMHAGFRHVDVRIGDGHVLAQCELVVDDRLADFTCRLALRVTPAGLRIVVADANVYGFVPRAGSLVLYQFWSALLGRPHDSDVGDADLVLAARLSMGVIETRPLARFLATVFPPAGWSIPSVATTRLVHSECAPGRLTVEYGPSEAADPVTHLAPRVHIYLRHRDAAEALMRGDLDRAAELYAWLGRDSPSRAALVARRVLEILLARESTHDRAERLAATCLDKWPTFVPGHLALAATAMARGDTARATTHFERVEHLALHAGHVEAAERCAVASQRQRS